MLLRKVPVCFAVWVVLVFVGVGASIHEYKNEAFIPRFNSFFFHGGSEASNIKSFIRFESITFTRPKEIARKQNEMPESTGVVEAIIVEVKDMDKIGHTYLTSNAICCNPSLAEDGSCKLGEVIIRQDPHNPGWPKKIQTPFLGRSEEASMVLQTLEINKTGTYYLYFVVCDPELKGTLISGRTVWGNPEGGKRTPMMTSYKFMSLAYLVLGLLWFVVQHWKDIIRLCCQITVVIGGLGMCEMAFSYYEYSNFRVTRSRPIGITLWAVTFSAIKNTVCRLLLLLVPMGYGVMWPTHGRITLKRILLGVVYFMASESFELVEHLGNINDFAGKAGFLVVPRVTPLDACFIVWIFSLLSKLSEKIQIRRSMETLELFRKIAINSLAVPALLPVAWIVSELYFNASDPRVVLAFWTLLAFMLLVVICMLLTPSDNSTRTTSSSMVGSNDDLMLQILLHIPAKPLTRLKLVSKRWESLISTNHASFLRNQGPLGLICPGQRIPSFEFIPLDVQNPTQPPFFELPFPGGVSGGLHWIKQSCNGLLLCCNADPRNFRVSCVWFPKLSCCVYNPTTNRFAQIPRPDGYPKTMLGLNLVFDPSKSPGYKVLFIYMVGALVQIEIYSSESRAWSLFGEPFNAKASFNQGIYWNGSIHWFNIFSKELLYFNFDKEELRKTPFPPTLIHDDRYPMVGYFGESRDHLHVVEIRGENIAIFDVHEMKIDYSGWFVRYRVDLTNANIDSGYRIFSLIRGEEGKCQSFLYFVEATGSLFFKATGKFARWNLDSNILEEIFVNENIVSQNRLIPYAFEYIESLASV